MRELMQAIEAGNINDRTKYPLVAWMSDLNDTGLFGVEDSPNIEELAREGRKFAACLVLISQKPVQLSTTALSQCNSNIILRVTNPYDLRHIEESCEGVTNEMMNMLPGLKVDEALITGEVVRYPLLVNVRERKSMESDKGINLEDELIRFQNKKSSDKNDLATFM